MRPSVCFVALKAYGVLSGDGQHSHVGGAEVQQALVARGLAQRGYDVSFITLDHGQDDGCQVGGIRIFKSCRSGEGLPGLRTVHPKWTHLAAAMRRANADVYYQRTCGIESGQVAMWCRRHGRRFVFGVGSDADCDKALATLACPVERWFYRYALRHADAIIAQTDSQRRLLSENFGLRSTVIPSCRPLPVQSDSRPQAPPRILWVGRFSPIKRPEWCLDLAERRGDLAFDIVGAGNEDTPYARSIGQRASRLPNITLHGYVPYERIGSFYDGATVLLSTSLYEGFPNIFLEAWSHARPVVGTVDPDGVVSSHGLGIVAGNLDGLDAGITRLLADPACWMQAAQGGRRYVGDHHGVDAAVSAYERLLAELASSSQA